MQELKADVVVVGFGGAGACAAIEASDSGASVIVLEKMPAGGGSTEVSSGSFRDVPDVKAAADHFSALTEGVTPPEVMEAFAKGAAEIPDFLIRLGGTIERLHSETYRFFPRVDEKTPFPSFPGADRLGGRIRLEAPGEQHFADGKVLSRAGGRTLWTLLVNAVNARGVTTLYDARASRLLMESGAVRGVEATVGGETVTVSANRGVVLTCGGFAYNREMQRQFLGAELPALGPPGRNTGDGIKMAQEIGADLWHTHATAAGWGYQVPGYEAAFFAQIFGKGFFVVDQKGHRYMNEPELDSHFGGEVGFVRDPIDGRHYRLPSYLIFNENLRSERPIVTTHRHSFNSQFGWSQDNSEEIEKGWIKVGSSFRDLARELGLPPEALEATARRFNEACANGGDPFGRNPEKMEPVDSARLYGIPIWPALLNTQGGPRRNEKAQVISAGGTPIPRLYAAGELGSIWGALYPGAGNVSETIVYGRIAGGNAARETPA